MDCIEYQHLLVHYLFQELPVSQYKNVQQHIYTCSACKGDLEKYKETLQILNKAPRPKPSQSRRQSIIEECRKVLCIVGTRYNLSNSEVNRAQSKSKKIDAVTIGGIIAGTVILSIVTLVLFLPHQYISKSKPISGNEKRGDGTQKDPLTQPAQIIEDAFKAVKKSLSVDEILSSRPWPSNLTQHIEKLRSLGQVAYNQLLPLVDRAGEERITAITLLGRLYISPKETPEFFNKLKAITQSTNESTNERRVSFQILTRFHLGGEVALDIIKNEGSEKFRLEAAKSLPGELTKDRAPELFEILRNEKSSEIIDCVKNVLIGWGGDEIINGFREIFKTGKNSQLRLMAASSLIALLGQGSMPDLEWAIASDPDIGLRRSLIKMVASSDDKKLKPLLVNIVKSHLIEPYIRSLALSIYVGQESKENVLPVLSEILTMSREPSIIAETIIQLGYIDDKKAQQTITEMLSSPDENVRDGALKATWYLDMGDAVQATKFLNDPNPNVRVWAFLILGDTKGGKKDEIRSLLQKGMEDPEEKVEAAAMIGLGRQGQRTSEFSISPSLKEKALNLALSEKKFIKDFLGVSEKSGKHQSNLIAIARRLESTLGLQVRIDASNFASYPITFFIDPSQNPEEILTDGLKKLGLVLLKEQGTLVVTTQ